MIEGTDKPRSFMLRMRPANPTETEADKVTAVAVLCTEEEIEGMKEHVLMKLEEKSGRAWVCFDIVDLRGVKA